MQLKLSKEAARLAWEILRNESTIVKTRPRVRLHRRCFVELREKAFKEKPEKDSTAKSFESLGGTLDLDADSLKYLNETVSACAEKGVPAHIAEEFDDLCLALEESLATKPQKKEK